MGDFQLKCDHFEPYITSSGICQVFNGANQKQLFKPSKYMDMFERVFRIPDENEIKMPTGFGPSSGLFMVLDNHWRNHPKTEPNDPIYDAKVSPDFVVSVGDTLSGFDVVRGGIRARAGYRTTIKLIPSQV